MVADRYQWFGRGDACRDRNQSGLVAVTVPVASRKKDNSAVKGHPMNKPEPAEDWPGRPLSEAEAADHLGSGVIGVWVMDHDEGVRSVAVPNGAPENAVIDVVLETEEAFEMCSYTSGRWMDYGTQRKDDQEAPSMAGTLASYRLLAGESTLEGADTES